MTAARPRYRGSGHPGAPVDRNPGAAARIPAGGRRESRRERVTAAAWLTLWELARAVPEPVAFAAADLVARVAYRRSASARRRVARNLQRVLDAEPDLARGVDVPSLVRDAFRSYARYWVESFRAADLDPADVDARTTTEGFEYLDAALERGRGVVVLLAHHGSWDVAARWAESHGYHLAVVAEVVRPRRLFERFVTLREAVGLEVVPLQRRALAAGKGRGGGNGGNALVTALTRVTAANHLVGLLSDRDLSGTGARVPLFGETASIPRGPAVLAQRTGAAVVPITMLQRPGRRWHLQVLPELDLPDDADEATARIAEAIEDLIRLDLAQWHCFQPVWLADRSDRRGRRA